MDQKTALELFEYRDGVLFWQKSPRRGIRKGSMVGCKTNKYVRIRLKNKTYYAHRIVYLMFHGHIPVEVDHIDCDKLNNKVENLRAATRVENGANLPLRKDNKSGVKNVCWHKAANKWQVSVKANGKRHNFGLFDDLELAALVASEARDKYHGKFARAA